MFRHLSKVAIRLFSNREVTSKIFFGNQIRAFSGIITSSYNYNAAAPHSQLDKQLLHPRSIANPPELNLNRGMKQFGRLRRRCKDCYFVMRHERLYVMCKTHPRHKQMQMKKKDKNTWILTDATQSKQRAW